MRFHAQTAGVSLTAQQPENNIVRTAIEALAAVLGGTQSLHTNSFDEALALPTEHAAKLALRTQQIIAHETGVASTADPLGGSWYLEALTDELERQAYAYFERIDALGGVIAAIRQGFFQSEIADASFRFQREVEQGERLIVGVNAYEEDESREIPLLRIDPDVEARQVERVKALRARRDAERAGAALGQLEQAARGDANLMPVIVEAARADVTMGEMCDVLRRVFGTWRETPAF
jgi:methylmalonyl-CoA mutase N-terminal domain/subunit